jgi:hypothetical protein
LAFPHRRRSDACVAAPAHRRSRRGFLNRANAHLKRKPSPGTTGYRLWRRKIKACPGEAVRRGRSSRSLFRRRGQVSWREPAAFKRKVARSSCGSGGDQVATRNGRSPRQTCFSLARAFRIRCDGWRVAADQRCPQRESCRALLHANALKPDPELGVASITVAARMPALTARPAGDDNRSIRSVVRNRAPAGARSPVASSSAHSTSHSWV